MDSQAFDPGIHVANTLRITEVRIRLCYEEKLRAWVSITLDDSFVVHGIKVIRGEAGFFVAMPNRKRSTGSFTDVAHPIRTSFRCYLEDVVLTAFWNSSGEGVGVPANLAPPPRTLFGAAAVRRGTDGELEVA